MDLKTALVFLEWLLNLIEFVTVHMADLATSKQKFAIWKDWNCVFYF